MSSNQSSPARNLRKTDLGAVIFGATHHTINECLSRHLFGLPEGHYSYIKNIKQGLVLFLFNYSDRKLHGIFEAAGPGQLNIDQYAWVTNEENTGYTRYPAQVKICIRKLCHPLSEEQFQHIISHNYYESKHFHFELDRDQTGKLVSLFTSSPMNSSISTKWNDLCSSLPATPKRQEYNAHVSLGVTNLKQSENPDQTLKVSYAAVLSRTNTTITHPSKECEVEHGQTSYLSGQQTQIEENHEKDDSLETSTNLQPLVAKLIQEFEVMKGYEMKQDVKISRLEQELDTSKQEIQQLRSRVSFLESVSSSIADLVKLVDS
ncbi:putative development/cell death domain-containing protein [Helianthus anomalus]